MDELTGRDANATKSDSGAATAVLELLAQVQVATRLPQPLFNPTATD